jgi:hypothetical protein
MSKQMKTLEELVREVPAECQEQVRNYVESLLAMQPSGQRSRPQFAWAGALRDLADRYKSVELQHWIARWRIDSE